MACCSGPSFPGISDGEDQLREVVDACVAAGAVSVGVVALHLRPGVREHFLADLGHQFPEQVEAYERRYRGRAYLPQAEQRQLGERVRSMVAEARRRHGWPRAGGPEEFRLRPAAAVQAGRQLEACPSIAAPPARARPVDGPTSGTFDAVIPIEDAQAAVLAGCHPLAPRALPFGEALGCVLARDVVAPEMVPPFDNTAVDGYAVRAADTAGRPGRARGGRRRSPPAPRPTTPVGPGRRCGS